MGSLELGRKSEGIMMATIRGAALPAQATQCLCRQRSATPNTPPPSRQQQQTQATSALPVGYQSGHHVRMRPRPAPEQGSSRHKQLTPLDSRVDTTSSLPCTAAAIRGVAPLPAGGMMDDRQEVASRRRPERRAAWRLTSRTPVCTPADN